MSTSSSLIRSPRIDILYFASLAEKLACDKETLDLPEDIHTIEDLTLYISSRGLPWSQLRDSTILSAVNHEMAKANSEIKDGDEVAFFPPVTGG